MVIINWPVFIKVIAAWFYMNNKSVNPRLLTKKPYGTVIFTVMRLQLLPAAFNTVQPCMRQGEPFKQKDSFSLINPWYKKNS